MLELFYWYVTTLVQPLETFLQLSGCADLQSLEAFLRFWDCIFPTFMPVFCDLPCHCSFNGWPLHELTMLSLLNSSVILSKICCWSEMRKLTVLFLLLVYAQILISVIMCTNFYWLLGGNQGLPSLKINCFKGVLTPNLLHLSVSSDNKCWYFYSTS